jgi:hypothetical protein
VGSAEYSSDTLEDQDDVDVSDDVMGKGIATKRTKSHNIYHMENQMVSKRQ